MARGTRAAVKLYLPDSSAPTGIDPRLLRMGCRHSVTRKRHDVGKGVGSVSSDRRDGDLFFLHSKPDFRSSFEPSTISRQARRTVAEQDVRQPDNQQNSSRRVLLGLVALLASRPAAETRNLCRHADPGSNLAHTHTCRDTASTVTVEYLGRYPMCFCTCIQTHAEQKIGRLGASHTHSLDKAP